jgi:DNA-binding NtrC family response regulator
LKKTEVLTLLGAPAVVSSAALRRALELARKVAQSTAAVLITGESGSGKEIIARALHQYSLRAHKPWVDISCAALPEHLIESELFGYEKGAFSGADSNKQGLFELAHGGTLYLDEIGELPAKMQVKLLRVLDGVPYYRLGGTRKISVDVRVLAATNQDLEVAIREGHFRADLYHRLNQFRIEAPPLRSRREDIAPLAEFFLAQQNAGLRFSEEAEETLRRHNWPGNVRELRNVVTRVAVLAEGPLVEVDDLPEEFRRESGGGAWNGAEVGALAQAVCREEATRFSNIPVNGAAATEASKDDTLDSMEKQMILSMLAATGGHQSKAAERLGISRRTLSRKLKLYGVSGDLEAERV